MFEPLFTLVLEDRDCGRTPEESYQFTPRGYTDSIIVDIQKQVIPHLYIVPILKLSQILQLVLHTFHSVWPKQTKLKIHDGSWVH